MIEVHDGHENEDARESEKRGGEDSACEVVGSFVAHAANVVASRRTRNTKEAVLDDTKHKIESVPQRRGVRETKDRRITRTRERIDAAFVGLLGWRAYGNIRVSEITRKARVGRATFYAHYSSKDDLLRSQFDRIVSPMLAITALGVCPLDATRLFDHIRSAPKFFKALMAGPDVGSAPRVLRDCFERSACQALDARESKLLATVEERDLEMAVVTRFVAASLLAVIECWAQKQSAATPETLQVIFGRLVGQGLSDAAAGDCSTSTATPRI